MFAMEKYSLNFTSATVLFENVNNLWISNITHQHICNIYLCSYEQQSSTHMYMYTNQLNICIIYKILEDTHQKFREIEMDIEIGRERERCTILMSR